MLLHKFVAFGTMVAFSVQLYADSPAENLLRRPDDWFRSDEGRKSLENILSWQTDQGDWPKNIDSTRQRFSGVGNKPAGTFDNGATSGASNAIERSIDCVLKCQVVVDGTSTVWCAQHDAETLAPVQARSYELPSLSGAESAGILKFLMSLEDPTPEVVRAVKAGATWFEAVKIEGYRYRKNATEPALAPDLNARPLWARFYEIETNQPIFSDRDGVVKYDIDEIGSERRGGYTWYGTWGSNVLKTYAKWRYR